MENIAKQNDKIKLGKKGINYVTEIVDNNQCNFHSILQENDVGIDGQIEFFDNSGLPLGKFACIQVKTGKSYYDIEKHICSIPVDTHRDYWLKIPFPVIGVVCVMNENYDRVETAYWINIKEYLKHNPEAKSISYEMSISYEFNQLKFKKYFIPLVHSNLPCIDLNETFLLFKGTSKDREIAINELLIKHSMYAKSWNKLFELYDKESEELPLDFFYDGITYNYSHPDHLYVNGFHEFSEESKQYVDDRVKKFEEKDIIKMLTVIEDGEISRGTIGQSIEILIGNIDNSDKKLLSVICNKDISIDLIITAEAILAYHNKEFFIDNIDKIRKSECDFSTEIIGFLQQFGEFDLY